jgi:hypothetical protein
MPVFGKYTAVWPRFLVPMWGIDASSQAGSVLRVWLTPVLVPENCKVDRISIYMSTASSGKRIRLGVYADNNGSPYWSPLLVDSGDIDVSATGTKTYAISPAVALPKGIVWVCVLTEDATMAYFRSANAVSYLGWAMDGCYYDLGAWGALTNPCPVITTSAASRPVIVMRVSEWGT